MDEEDLILEDECEHENTEDVGGEIICLQCGITLEEKE